MYRTVLVTDAVRAAGWKTSSLNPARSVNLAHRKGSLEAGKDADLVLVDDAINVYLTMVEGRIICCERDDR